ncbi:hypothetical protein FN846DRAFT_998124 [Sphaerosporella brunnea]|uniref:Uncharacterized protein n=1 Tax=Sphaerosporella brunnea TaxID=1250544 RepID=A0A5J5EH38_9PEZI|nr:hypothetical protein FN846DRAFT_998124 [Sphaerosporella brunnea]
MPGAFGQRARLSSTNSGGIVPPRISCPTLRLLMLNSCSSSGSRKAKGLSGAEELPSLSLAYITAGHTWSRSPYTVRDAPLATARDRVVISLASATFSSFLRPLWLLSMNNLPHLSLSNGSAAMWNPLRSPLILPLIIHHTTPTSQPSVWHPLLTLRHPIAPAVAGCKYFFVPTSTTATKIFRRAKYPAPYTDKAKIFRNDISSPVANQCKNPTSHELPSGKAPQQARSKLPQVPVDT